MADAASAANVREGLDRVKMVSEGVGPGSQRHARLRPRSRCAGPEPTRNAPRHSRRGLHAVKKGLQPHGFGLLAPMINFPGGVPGHLEWRPLPACYMKSPEH
jgi:hypothetical protein